jgi:hypothetical protein
MVETSKLLFWQAIHVWIFSGIAGTALRRQGRSVARAAGPRHRRPRLRHRIHRRGEASAASRPPQACARVVETVRLSAQPPADRSVQRLIPRCRWTAPAICWAARPRSCPPSARQRARTAAALCPCHWFLSPPIPLQGTLRITYAPAGSAAVPLLSRVLCGLSSLLVSVWNVLPPGSCVKAWPRGAHQQNGHCGLTAPEGRRVYQAGSGAGGARLQALGMRGDRRCTRVPDAVLAWAGGQRGGSVPPHPYASRSADLGKHLWHDVVVTANIIPLKGASPWLPPYHRLPVLCARF